jgi:DNA polymerase theta
MKRMQGLLHKTTLQATQEQRQRAVSVPSTSQKRSWSTANAENVQDALPASAVQFRRAISLPLAQCRLTASPVVYLQASDGPSEYSQRRVIAATPASTADPELNLAHPIYDLPPQLVQNFASLGIKSIYPWQKNCLKGPGLLSGTRNLVYCAPTGGGKSLVADCKPFVS